MKLRRLRRPAPPTVALLAPLLAALLAVAACSSPNRGTWHGTFDGSVTGVMEFRIDSRGSHLQGDMEGATRDGQPFSATLEGRLRGEDFYATFEGTSPSGLMPVRFTGLMRGRLGAGQGDGDWTAEVPRLGGTLRGTWRAEQAGTGEP